MLALLPHCNDLIIIIIIKDAAAKCLSRQQIKKREMEVHQACIGIIARELNKYSNAMGEVDVLCPDGKVYGMNTLLWYACLQLGQARVSRVHFKHVGSLEPAACNHSQNLFRREACSMCSYYPISDLRVILESGRQHHHAGVSDAMLF
jgi:hypothetical protein